jgi:hypothetical protein
VTKTPKVDKIDVVIDIVPKRDFTDEVLCLLRYYWESLKKLGAYKKRFPHGDVNNFDDFMKVVVDPDSILFLVFNKEDMIPVGEFMLTNFSGLSANIHFSLNPKYYRWGVQIAQDALRQAFTLERADFPGEKMLESIIGITPVSNKLALMFNEKVGFKEIATIPKGFFVHGTGFVDARATLLINGEI